MSDTGIEATNGVVYGDAPSGAPPQGGNTGIEAPNGVVYGDGDTVAPVTVTAPSLKPTDDEKNYNNPLSFIGSMLYNVPGSAANLVGGVGNTLLHPIKTAETLGLAAGGGMENGYNALAGLSGLPQVPNIIPTDTANQMGQAVMDRYGSIPNAMHTLRTDPVGVLADASIVAPGLGETLGAAKLAEAANLGEHAGNVLNFIASKTTGAAPETLRTAFNAGKVAGPEDAVFNAAKDSGDLKTGQSALIDQAEKGAASAPPPVAKTGFDPKPAIDSLEDFNTKNFNVNREDSSGLLNDLAGRPPEDIIQTKNSLDNFLESSDAHPSDPGRLALEHVSSTLGDQIQNQFPEFVEHQGKVQAVSDAAEQARADMAAGKDPTESLKALSDAHKELYPDEDLFKSLKAGQDSSSLLPHGKDLLHLGLHAATGLVGSYLGSGLGHNVIGGTTGALISGIPQSPLLVGTAANLGGKAASAAGGILSKTDALRALTENALGPQISSRIMPSALGAGRASALDNITDPYYIQRLAPDQPIK